MIRQNTDMITVDMKRLTPIINDDNENSKSNLDLVDEGNSEKKTIEEMTSSQCTNMDEVKVINFGGDLHLGTQVIFNRPDFVSVFQKKDLFTKNQKESECTIGQGKDKGKIETQKKYQECNKTKIDDKVKITKKVVIYKILILIASLILIQIPILISFNIFRHTPDFQEVKHCSGINSNTIDLMKSEMINSSEIPVTYIPRENWGFHNNCTFKCCIKNLKSTVRLSIVRANFLPGLIEVDKSQSTLFWNDLDLETQKQMNNTATPFNDIYFNFILGFNGFIFEGRHLSCGFEEDQMYLKENHSKKIVLGIPYCFPGDTGVIKKYTGRLQQSTDALLKILEKLGILDGNYTLELPDICEGTTLVNMTVTNKAISRNIIFYDFMKNDPLSNDTMKSYKQLASNLSFEFGMDTNNWNSTSDDGDSADFSLPLTSIPGCNETDPDYQNNTNISYSIVIFKYVPDLPNHTEISVSNHTMTSHVWKDLFQFSPFSRCSGCYSYTYNDDVVFINDDVSPDKSTFNISDAKIVVVVFQRKEGFSFISSYLHLLQRFVEHRSIFYRLINNKNNEPKCNVLRIFLFDFCEHETNIIQHIYDFYHLFGFNVTYVSNRRYFFDSYDECHHFTSTNVTPETMQNHSLFDENHFPIFIRSHLTVTHTDHANLTSNEKLAIERFKKSSRKDIMSLEKQLVEMFVRLLKNPSELLL